MDKEHPDLPDPTEEGAEWVTNRRQQAQTPPPGIVGAAHIVASQGELLGRAEEETRQDTGLAQGGDNEIDTTIYDSDDDMTRRWKTQLRRLSNRNQAAERQLAEQKTIRRQEADQYQRTQNDRVREATEESARYYQHQLGELQLRAQTAEAEAVTANLGLIEAATVYRQGMEDTAGRAATAAPQGAHGPHPQARLEFLGGFSGQSAALMMDRGPGAVPRRSGTEQTRPA